MPRAAHQGEDEGSWYLNECHLGNNDDDHDIYNIYIDPFSKLQRPKIKGVKHTKSAEDQRARMKAPGI